MADTLTIRLEQRDRAILEAAARRRGIGLSAFVRDLAEDAARQLSRAAIKADGEIVVSYLKQHPQGQDELDTFGTPVGDLP